MSSHISYISKSCFSLIRDLRRIRNSLDLNTAKTISTSVVHSRLDYCNFLFLTLPNNELNRLQLVLNMAARTTTKTPKYLHITPILIHYTILSITYKLYNLNNLLIIILVFHYKLTTTLVPPL